MRIACDLCGHEEEHADHAAALDAGWYTHIVTTTYIGTAMHDAEAGETVRVQLGQRTEPTAMGYVCGHCSGGLA